MNAQVKAWLEAQNKELAEKKAQIDKKDAEEQRAKREQILLNAGLYTDANKEYFDPNKHTIKELSLFTESEMVDGEKRFYRCGVRKAIEVTDEEFAAICDMIEKKKLFEKIPEKSEQQKDVTAAVHVEEKHDPDYFYELKRDERVYETSNMARYIQFMALLIWVCGIVVSIFGSFEMTVTRYGDYEREFSFILFIQNIVTYILLGLVTWWSSEVFENIQSIVNELRGLRLVRKKDK